MFKVLSGHFDLFIPACVFEMGTSSVFDINQYGSHWLVSTTLGISNLSYRRSI